MTFPYLSAIVFLPLVGAIAIGFVPGGRPQAIRLAAAAFSFASLLLSLAVYGQFDPFNPNPQFVERLEWIPGMGVAYFLGVDGLSLPLVVLTTLLTFASVLYSWHIELRVKEYFILLLILEWGILGVFTALDLLLFFLFWEVELIPMYLLIGVWGGPRREYAAIKFVLYTMAGSAFMLVGILALYFGAEPHTFDMLKLQAMPYAAAFQAVVFLLILAAFAIKLPIFPFHTWLPDAHVEAPTAVSVILAGVLLKMGGYGIFRVLYTILPAAAVMFAPYLALLAVVNVLYGAGLSMVQTDLKKMIAYSSISHMGFVLLGAAALTPLAFNGAILEMFAHGTITGLMFMLAGTLQDKIHTRDIPSMGGLAPRMPWLAAIFSLAGLASLGLPGMAGFVAEVMVFLGSYGPWPVYTILAVSGVVVTAGYILWMLQRVFFGPTKPDWEHAEDAHGLELVPLVTLIAVTILVGVYPRVVTMVIDSSVGPLIARLGS